MFDAPDVIDDDEDISLWNPDPDPISVGVGAPGYLHHYTLDECVERFPDSTAARFPETFDRFYFDTPHGRLLVDLLQDGTPDQLEHERERKRVEFKQAWCEQHGWRYLPLAESDLAAPKIAAILAREPGDQPRVSQPARPKVAKRGQIQRPKAD